MKRKLEQSENTIESLIKQAQNFLAQNRLPEALEGFKSVLALDNSNIIANAGYKEVMFREGIQLNKSDSLDDFFSELQREPHPDAAQAYRADRYRQQGDFETALKNYNELLKQDAANLFLRAGRGAMFLEQKRLEEAFNDLNFVLCSDPQHILR